MAASTRFAATAVAVWKLAKAGVPSVNHILRAFAFFDLSAEEKRISSYAFRSVHWAAVIFLREYCCKLSVHKAGQVITCHAVPLQQMLCLKSASIIV